jgi:hemerythrin-like domain-containing protein
MPSVDFVKDPIEILLTEHSQIKTILDGLEAMAEAAEVGAFTDRGTLLEVGWFLKEYTDVKHHTKEEEYLFPVLELLGVPAKGGPTDVMRQEHIQGRKLVGLIHSLLEVDSENSNLQWAEIAGASLAYVRLLRSHIEKEDHCVFGLADGMLTPPEKEALASVFGRVDREWDRQNGTEASNRVEAILGTVKNYLRSV